jgi:transcriptional regulator with XRE-family HTH domain
MGYEDETKSILRENLINFRKANNLTQEELAKALNLKDHTAYGSYEIGRAVPKISSIVRLAKIYNTTTDLLLTNTEAPKMYNQLRVEADIKYDHEIYGDKYLSELEGSEKLFIMRFRQLTKSDKMKVAEFIDNLLPD